MDSSESSFKICLRPYDPSELNENIGAFDDMIALWEALRCSSVVAAQFPFDSFTVFREHCFYFATVQAVQTESQKEQLIPRRIYTQTAHHDESYGIRDPIQWPSSSQNDFSEETDTQRHQAVHVDPLRADRQFLTMHSENNYETRHVNPILGFICLSSPHIDLATDTDINLCVILKERYQGHRYGPQAVSEVLKYAFNDLQFHRVQAVIMDCPSRLNALSMLTRLGFNHEGVRRRSVSDPKDGVWKDATYLAILDTDWSMRLFHNMPRTLWDELLMRHSQEREELLRLENRILKRSASNETLGKVERLSDIEEISQITDSMSHLDALEKRTEQTENVSQSCTRSSTKNDLTGLVSELLSTNSVNGSSVSTSIKNSDCSLFATSDAVNRYPMNVFDEIDGFSDMNWNVQQCLSRSSSFSSNHPTGSDSDWILAEASSVLSYSLISESDTEIQDALHKEDAL